MWHIVPVFGGKKGDVDTDSRDTQGLNLLCFPVRAGDEEQVLIHRLLPPSPGTWLDDTTLGSSQNDSSLINSTKYSSLLWDRHDGRRRWGPEGE